MDIHQLIKTLEPIFLQNAFIVSFMASLIEISPAGWTIPGGYILAIGGFFAFDTPHHLITIILGASIGSLVVFVAAYVLGLKTGMWLVKKLKQEKNAQYAKALLNKHGGKILTISLMSPLLRFWVAYVAGSQRYNFSKFVVYATLASFSWSTMWIMIGFLIGSQRLTLEENLTKLGVIGWICVIVPTLLVTWFIKKDYENTRH